MGTGVLCKIEAADIRLCQRLLFSVGMTYKVIATAVIFSLRSCKASRNWRRSSSVRKIISSASAIILRMPSSNSLIPCSYSSAVKFEVTIVYLTLIILKSCTKVRRNLKISDESIIFATNYKLLALQNELWIALLMHY